MFGKLVQHVLPAVIKPMRVLWNEVIGFIFLVLAVGGIVRAWQEIQNATSPFTIAVPVIWTVVMAFFGVTSFVRARRISRS